MPLTLITGPANAAKAGAVLERFRVALPREPVLVVPTSADVEHYQRELSAEGIVVGAEVSTFPRLVRGLASITGVRARVLGAVARERLVRAAVADADLQVLARSAAAPGFAAAAGALFAELGRSLVGPARFVRAVRDWEAAGDAPAHAGELAALYSGYHRRLEALGAVDLEGLARAALDALRENPAAWGGRPVFLYGFDDLTPLQRDAVETLARHADVCVALAYEPGRAAFAGRAATVELLKPLAERHELLHDRSEHYAPAARAALHHLERELFEPAPLRRAPNGAVRLLEAGGERAEAELVAAEVLELMGDGVVPEDIAVLVRESGEVVAQVLEAYGVPVNLDRRPRLDHTRLGAGVLAGARAALPGGTAADLMTWLRTPGRLADPDAADGLETWVRRAEVATAAAIRPRLAGPDEPTALDALADAAAAGPEAFLDALAAEADAIWTAPHRRAAAVLGPEEAADARAAAALREGAAELKALAAADPRLAGSPQELLEALAALPVREPAVEGAVLVADPLAIRARRFRAVFVCGLQEGVFPRHPEPEPFLDDAARIALARASGIVLPRHEDVLARERYLLYAAVSRPEEVLFLSFRASDEEGEPVQPSAFVDDVRALFTDELWERRGRRLLAEVTWPPGSAPTPHELRRARRRRGERRRAAAARRASRRSGARRPGRARHRGRARAGGVRRLRRALADREPAAPAARRAGPRADVPRLARPCAARGDAAPHRAADPGVAPGRARGARRGDRQARGPPRRPRERRRSCASSRSRCGACCAARRRPAPGTSRATSSGASAAPTTHPARCRSRAVWASPAGSTGSTSGPTAARSCATTRAATSRPAHAGRRTGGCRSRSTRSPPASCSSSSRPGRSTSRSAPRTCAPGASCARVCPAAT